MAKIALDLTDRKILSELDRNCRIPASILAKRVGKSREAVKYRVGQLVQSGVIEKFQAAINPSKLGNLMFKVYLKLENTPDEREKFFEELKENKQIYWMGISDGAYDCVFAILSKSAEGFYDEINFLLSRWQHLIVSKYVGTMVDTTAYNKKFFLSEKDGIPRLVAGQHAENSVDGLDMKILSILANDARLPIAELSRRVGSTIEIARSRIGKMEEKGIIVGYRIAVDFNKLGLEFFKAILYFKSLSEKDEKALYEWMRVHPNSLYYIRSLAPWEAEFEFAVESYQHFNSIINELRRKFPQVIRNYEHLIMIYESWMPAYSEMLRAKTTSKPVLQSNDKHFKPERLL
ncbi:MAG TPA: winged helix-turn-helix transcriptional regulator [Candidatus Diapherotrites archaeon]|uniref:Winged helix-turn-helix transcriptional regulator n=1 Tax=Candidatus Iainarchaeum sp. TaxID=3101447 RepID=A0A7J4J4D9_9ARCH|nr:winged helix-turn-helix transcriptional regulator [Candidatus Diapherotrites archaeon]